MRQRKTLLKKAGILFPTLVRLVDPIEILETASMSNIWLAEHQLDQAQNTRESKFCRRNPPESREGSHALFSPHAHH